MGYPQRWAGLCPRSPAVHESKRHDADNTVALSTSNTSSRLSPCAFSGFHIYLLPPFTFHPSFPFRNTRLPSLVSSIISRLGSGKSLDPARPTLLAFGESTTSQARQPKPVQASSVFSSTDTTNTHLHSIPSSCLWHPPSFRSSSSSGISTLPDSIATYTYRDSLLLVPSSSLS